ncbi:hypothetical protein Aave_3873 [Paracidovorax citrulli AAC00-1]|uniref:Uncharacterized protein n=1 Tax=Paracidovorax citrulli (strain AAC00-1) TaxID=397945 RepID=A1TTY0_PARC0|nr:hypothetical protein Aave_3873 [Paracidovorax citrulli AAC00-1]
MRRPPAPAAWWAAGAPEHRRQGRAPASALAQRAPERLRGPAAAEPARLDPAEQGAWRRDCAASRRCRGERRCLASRRPQVRPPALRAWRQAWHRARPGQRRPVPVAGSPQREQELAFS